jgi:serine/threonine-protein kinase
MAPEQIQGEAVDGRTDLYTTGVVLYELVTGRKPFEGDHTYELMSAHVERRPPPPRAIRPDVPIEVQAVLLAALAKEPRARFQTAEAMRAALLQAATVLPSAAFAAVELPGGPSRRTPTSPPGSMAAIAAVSDLPVTVAAAPDDVAAAASPRGSPTVPLRARDRQSGGTPRAEPGVGAGNGARASGPAGPTLRGKPPTKPPAAAAPAAAAAAAAAAAPPAAAAAAATAASPGSREAPIPPPPGASTAVPRSRRPMIIAGIAIAGVAIAAAFVLGRQLGRNGGAARVTIDAGSGSAGSAAALLDAATGGLTVTPLSDTPPVPAELDARLIARRLHVLDLRPELRDYLRLAADPRSPAAAQLPQMLPQLVAEVDRIAIDAALVDAKYERVSASADTSRLARREQELVLTELGRTAKSIAKRDPIAANEHLWRAEWWLDHATAPPW